MSLENLVKIGQLNRHEATPEGIQRLLAAARRNLQDAGVSANSHETRFDCAYKAIMQCALAALQANGYRPSTNAPGHHQTMLQSLPLTIGASNETWITLNALRKKRNLNDYTGAPLEQGAMEEAIAQARHLMIAVAGWLKKAHPSLLR